MFGLRHATAHDPDPESASLGPYDPGGDLAFAHIDRGQGSDSREDAEADCGGGGLGEAEGDVGTAATVWPLGGRFSLKYTAPFPILICPIVNRGINKLLACTRSQ